MTEVIRKYVKLGVLNYIDHETPRQYFLWDGIMEDEPGRVHSVVEELCNENIKLNRKVIELEAELDTMKNSGIIEVASRNNRVTEYMFHWEGRTLDAEAKLEKALQFLDKLWDEQCYDGAELIDLYKELTGGKDEN